MDTDALVIAPHLIEGGAEGLDQIARALRARGLSLEGVYLASERDEHDTRRWFLRLVTPNDAFQVLMTALELQRDGLLPKISDRVTLAPVRPDDRVASGILAYARTTRSRPLVLEGVGLDAGVYVDYALIGSSIPAAA